MDAEYDDRIPSVLALVKVNVPDLLRFFDEKPDWAERHATAVVGELSVRT